MLSTTLHSPGLQGPDEWSPHQMLARYEAYLLASGRAASTARAYLGKIVQLSRHYPLMHVTKYELIEYLAAHRHQAAETRKATRAAFRSFFRWAYAEGLRADDPAYQLEPIRVLIAPPRVAADDIVQYGLLTADLHTTAMVLLARYACLRLSELTNLHPRDREGDLLRVNGKGAKVRLVPVNAPLMEVLVQLERKQGRGCPYFPGRFGGSMHPQSVNKIITRKMGVNPHSLRHAGATAAYKATGDLRAVQMLLGHASIATTQRYLHIGIDAVRAVAEATIISGRFSNFPATTLPPVA